MPIQMFARLAFYGSAFDSRSIDATSGSGGVVVGCKFPAHEQMGQIFLICLLAGQCSRPNSVNRKCSAFLKGTQKTFDEGRKAVKDAPVFFGKDRFQVFFLTGVEMLKRSDREQSRTVWMALLLGDSPQRRASR